MNPSNSADNPITGPNRASSEADAGASEAGASEAGIAPARGPRGASPLKWVKQAVRLVVLALVAWGVWRTVIQANTRLVEEDFQLSDVNPGWLLLAAALYLAGMLPSWNFWHRTLHAMGQRPGRLHSLRAFYIGHLGKYVPGKALVVVLRTGLVRGPGVDTTVAATSVFVETLTFMAVGASLSAVLLMFVSDQWWLIGLAVGLLFCAGVPTIPPIFRSLVRMLGVRRANPEIDTAIEGLSWRLLTEGWLSVSVGWILFGASLWATLRAVPAGMLTADISSPWLHLPLLTACVGLAMVAGFLSLIPGGLGVRELVLIPLLTPVYGDTGAMVAAVLLRLVWLVAELAASGMLYFSIRSPGNSAAVSHSGSTSSSTCGSASLASPPSPTRE